MCYTCKSEDHFKKECYRCQACGNIKKDPAHPREFEMRCCVCLNTNHRVESCRRLRRAGPGKYCNLCKEYGTHTYSECRQKPYVKHYVKAITDDNDANDAYQDDRIPDYWDTVPEYYWDKAKTENDSNDDDNQILSEDDQ